MAINLFVLEHELVWEDPEVHVVRVPYAHCGLAHTNCYIIRDGADTLVIDPGVRSLTAKAALTRSAKSIGVDLAQARYLCTHLHFDHVGMVKDLSRPGTHILLGQTAYFNNPWNRYSQRKKILRSVLEQEGVPPMAMRGLAAFMSEVRVCDLPDRVYKLFADGERVRVGSHALRVIETPGHSRGHICLLSEDEGFLISGDHVLESITPGISLPFEGDDSMGDYLSGLAKLEALECRAVLPGHGEAFYDLAGRIAALRDYHAARLAQVYETVALNPGEHGYAITRAMPWTKRGPFKNWGRLNPYLRLNMVSQTFAYLEFLVRSGELVRSEGEDGRRYFIAQ